MQCLRGLRVHGASKLDEQVRTRFAFCDAPSRVGADVIIVDDLSNPGERAEWAATLQGSYLVTSTTLQDMRGAQLKYHRALKLSVEEVDELIINIQYAIKQTGVPPRLVFTAYNSLIYCF